MTPRGSGKEAEKRQLNKERKKMNLSAVPEEHRNSYKRVMIKERACAEWKTVKLRHPNRFSEDKDLWEMVLDIDEIKTVTGALRPSDILRDHSQKTRIHNVDIIGNVVIIQLNSNIERISVFMEVPAHCTQLQIQCGVHPGSITGWSGPCGTSDWYSFQELREHEMVDMETDSSVGTPSVSGSESERSSPDRPARPARLSAGKTTVGYSKLRRSARLSAGKTTSVGCSNLRKRKKKTKAPWKYALEIRP